MKICGCKGSRKLKSRADLFMKKIRSTVMESWRKYAARSTKKEYVIGLDE